mmetsp:Transcript_6146/g.8970  ORF Transcript_6146/g.8970 Transcript_6146/m.8970 type:complete len:528 (+) Transcript_6146:339-1922(+)
MLKRLCLHLHLHRFYSVKLKVKVPIPIQMLNRGNIYLVKMPRWYSPCPCLHRFYFYSVQLKILINLERPPRKLVSSSSIQQLASEHQLLYLFLILKLESSASRKSKGSKKNRSKSSKVPSVSPSAIPPTTLNPSSEPSGLSSSSPTSTTYFPTTYTYSPTTATYSPTLSPSLDPTTSLSMEPPTHSPTPTPTNPNARITATNDLAQPSTPVSVSVSSRFGRSVAISGTSALVGAPNADDDGNVFGAVYLFNELTDNAQKYESKLDAPAPTPSDVRFRCGHSVALSEEYLVMGCPGYKDFENGSYSNYEIGAMSIYRRGFTTPLRILFKAVPDAHAQFGTSVAINSAGIVAVGTRIGIVELYDQKRAPPHSPFRVLGEPDLNLDPVPDNFGWSVALNDENWLAVGAIKQDGGNGSVFLWRNLSLSTDPEEIPAPAAARDDCRSLVDGEYVEVDCEFGYSVAFSGKNLVVGSRSTRNQAGRAFVYDLTLEDFKDNVQSLPANPPDGSEFGFSVAMTDEAVIVGSRKYSA